MKALPSAPTQATQAGPVPKPAAADDDFDLLAPAPTLDAEARAKAEETTRALERRRWMLQMHQVAGFVNLAAMTTAVVLGQLNFSDKYGGGGDTGKFITPHAIAAYTSAAIFTGTGLLALFAPSPIDKPARLDSATLHKTAMAIATAGMIGEVVLGIITASQEGKLSQRDLALVHQINGYVTLGATATGFTVLFF